MFARAVKTARRLTRAGKRGQQDRREDTDDRDDHEQFDQGKAAQARCFHRGVQRGFSFSHRSSQAASLAVIFAQSKGMGTTFCAVSAGGSCSWGMSLRAGSLA